MQLNKESWEVRRGQQWEKVLCLCLLKLDAFTVSLSTDSSESNNYHTSKKATYVTAVNRSRGQEVQTVDGF